MKRLVLLPALLVLGACSEQSFNFFEESKAIPDPDIEVSPLFLDFGEVASGEQILRSFTVSNEGAATLHVTDLELITAGPFSILTPETDFDFFLDPGGMRDFEVVFEPIQATTATGEITVFSDDADEPQVVVDLTAVAAVPELVISPDNYDFGDSAILCDDSVDLTLTNVGKEPLVISALDYTSSTGEMVLIDPNLWPITLETNDIVEVSVDYEPLMKGPSTGLLEVTSTDPRGVVTAEQFGSGVYGLEVQDKFVVPDPVVDVHTSPSRVLEGFTAPKYKLETYKAPTDQIEVFTAPEYQTDSYTSAPLATDSFTAPTLVSDEYLVPEEPPVDILFAVDQSGSMDSVSSQLGANFATFISEINTVTNGWHIGVVTNDDGCFNSGILDENTANYQSVFTAAVQAGGCAGGYPTCKTESLLELTSIALSKTGAGQCNDGFLRPGALLHVIAVSDEKEQSGQTWSHWVWDFGNYVTDPSLLKVSGIVDYNKACGDSSGAVGYEEAVNYTGGELLDVCSTTWSNATQDLAVASLSAVDEYALSQVPEQTTIQVFVDGVEWTVDWHYDSTSNSVVFDVSLSGGEDLEITYVPSGALVTMGLTHAPDPSSIVVYVNGSSWSSGWSYDSATNTIVFDTPLYGGEDVDVEYVPAASAQDYILTSIPDPSTISVEVAGVSVSNWSYDSTSNSIVFSGSVTPSATVRVTYLAASASMAYALANVPDTSSIIVEVDGVVWSSDWHYDSSLNAIVFDVEVAEGQTISVTYWVNGSAVEYILSAVPDLSTLMVSVDGVIWYTNWSYDATLNAIEFLVPLPSAAVVQVYYAEASASNAYALSSAPDETTLVVYVDGVPWYANWSYDSASNAVVFSTVLPSQASVHVEYIPLSANVVYSLSGTPRVNSIIVRVDGVPWSSNWVYDASTNTVVFDVALPDASTVQIEYMDIPSTTWFFLSDVPDLQSLVVRVEGTQWTSDWTYKANNNAIKFLVDLDAGWEIEANYGVLSGCP